MTNLELTERVNRSGGLADVIEQFQPGKILEAAEVIEERETLPEKEGVADLFDGDLFWSESFPLQTSFVWAGNFAMLTHEGGEAFLYFGGNEANPLFNTEKVREHREATDRQRYIHFAGDDFKPTQAGIDAVLASVESGSTLRLKLSDLQLSEGGDADGKSKMVLRVGHYGENLNAAGRSFTEKAYGSLENIEPGTVIYIERSDYIKSAVKDAGKGAKPTDAIVRACSFSSDQFDNDFSADEWVLGHEYLVRGIPVVTEEDQAGIHQAYETLFECPASSAALMGVEVAFRMTKLLAKAQQYNPALNASPESISSLHGIHPERQSEVEKAYDTLLNVPEASAKLITPEQFQAVTSMREAIRAWQNW